MKNGEPSQRQSRVSGQDSLNADQEVLGGELFVFDAGGPGDSEAEFIAVLEPKRDLVDGGVFEIVGKRGLAGLGGSAGEDVAAGVRDAGKLKVEGCRLKVKRRLQGDDAGATNEVRGGGDFGPASGLGGFSFEFGDGFDGVAGRG